MSTLVKLLLALVLHLSQTGEVTKEKTISNTDTVNVKYSIQELNPHYIITRDELLSQQDKPSI